jgi:biotin carboxyl carrier protein
MTADSTLTVCVEERRYDVELLGEHTLVNGVELPVELEEFHEATDLRFRSSGRSFHAVVTRVAGESLVLFRGKELRVRVETERDRLLRIAAVGTSGVKHHEEIKASMPGLVVRLLAETGSRVTRGQPLLILEAMKMENEIRSPVDGLLNRILVKERQVVEKGDLLAVLD